MTETKIELTDRQRRNVWDVLAVVKELEGDSNLAARIDAKTITRAAQMSNKAARSAVRLAAHLGYLAEHADGGDTTATYMLTDEGWRFADGDRPEVKSADEQSSGAVIQMTGPPMQIAAASEGWFLVHPSSHHESEVRAEDRVNRRKVVTIDKVATFPIAGWLVEGQDASPLVVSNDFAGLVKYDHEALPFARIVHTISGPNGARKAAKRFHETWAQTILEQIEAETGEIAE